MGEICPRFQLVAAPPLFLRKFVDRQEFELIGCPPPGVEEVATPPFGGNEHVFGTLAVRIAVKPGVAKHRAQKRAGTELVAIGSPDPRAPLPFIRRGGLGNERRDICELISLRKPVYVYR